MNSRSELFDGLLDALPAGWRESYFVVKFFYAEPDELPTTSDSETG